jgi:hypothetical protein
MRHRPVLLLACALALGCSRVPEGAPHVEKRLVASMPLGSSPVAVMNYLDSQKIRHTPYQHREAGSEVDASLPDKINVSRLTLIKIDYGLELHFDNHDRLTRLKVTEHLTGP